MAGLIYNILHDIPFSHEGNYIMRRGGREQLGAEGLIMAALSSLFLQ